ncbi:MAG: sigma-70 family RNA polymerase sigma factor [Planctomycetota bacterium]
MTDTDALQRYATLKDPEAFATLVERYQQMVYTACMRCLNNHDADARDATQDTFVKLAKSAGSIRGNLVGWLHRTAKNSSIDLVRSESRRREREITTPPRREAIGPWSGSSAPAHDDPDWPEVRAALDEVLDELPERYRVLIVQRYLAGRTQQAMAEEYGVSQSMISRKLAKAVEVLRQRLQSRGFVIGTVALTAGMSSEVALATPVGLGGWPTMVGVAGVGPTAATGVGGGLFAAGAGKLAAVAFGGALAIGAAAYVVTQNASDSPDALPASTAGAFSAGPGPGTPSDRLDDTGGVRPASADPAPVLGVLDPALTGRWMLRIRAEAADPIEPWARGSVFEVDGNAFVWRTADGGLLYHGRVESMKVQGVDYWQQVAVEIGDGRAAEVVQRRPFLLHSPAFDEARRRFAVAWSGRGDGDVWLERLD